MSFNHLLLGVSASVNFLIYCRWLFFKPLCSWVFTQTNLRYLILCLLNVSKLKRMKWRLYIFQIKDCEIPGCDFVMYIQYWILKHISGENFSEVFHVMKKGSIIKALLKASIQSYHIILAFWIGKRHNFYASLLSDLNDCCLIIDLFIVKHFIMKSYLNAECLYIYNRIISDKTTI